MMTRSYIVYFSCLECGACYSATQAPCHKAQPDHFSCENCKSVVYRWCNAYNYTGWQRYRPTGKRDGQIHQHGEQQTQALLR